MSYSKKIFNTIREKELINDLKRTEYFNELHNIKSIKK
jgi:hypothetical protein